MDNSFLYGVGALVAVCAGIKLTSKESFDAETFNSYKVAPALSSYSKDELISSKAGPQGSASYDEMVYDPIAQDRLSAEEYNETFNADEPKAIILYDIVWKTNKDLPEGVYISAYDEEALEGHRDEDIQDYLYERFNDYAHSYKLQLEGGNYTPDAFTDMNRFPEKYGAEYFASDEYRLCEICESTHHESEFGNSDDEKQTMTPKGEVCDVCFGDILFDDFQNADDRDWAKQYLESKGFKPHTIEGSFEDRFVNAESFEAEDAFKGMRKGSTKIIEGFDVKKTDKYNYRITDETLKDGSFVVLMYETRIIPYETRHDMEGYNWKEGWTFSEASFSHGVLGGGYYNTQNPPPMKKWDRSMSYGFNTQMEALKFLKKAYDNGDFEDGHLIFDAEGIGKFEVQIKNDPEDNWETIGTFESLKDAEKLYFDDKYYDKVNFMQVVEIGGEEDGEDFIHQYQSFFADERYEAETFEGDSVLNQESFDKLMGQLDRMTYNELYMIRHQTQLRLRELDNNLHY